MTFLNIKNRVENKIYFVICKYIIQTILRQEGLLSPNTDTIPVSSSTNEILLVLIKDFLEGIESCNIKTVASFLL